MLVFEDPRTQVRSINSHKQKYYHIPDVVAREEDGCTCIQALEEAGQAGDSHYHVGVGVDIHRVEAGN